MPLTAFHGLQIEVFREVGIPTGVRHVVVVKAVFLFGYVSRRPLAVFQQPAAYGFSGQRAYAARAPRKQSGEGRFGVKLAAACCRYHHRHHPVGTEQACGVLEKVGKVYKTKNKS